MPTPGSPTMVTMRHARSATVRSSSASSASSSASRPTIGESSRRATPAASASTSSRRHASTGSDFPFSSSGGICSAVTASRTRRMVASPTRISPAAAEASSRCATTTASPVANGSPCAGSPAYTSPVWTPVRTPILIPYTASSSSFRRPSSPRSSTAARTARNASSSCTTGIPKTASTASPTNFSIVPP